MRHLARLALALSVSVAPLALHADTYNYNIVTADANGVPGSGFTVSGNLTGGADPYAPGAFDITSITSNGTVSGYSFSGVVSPGTTDSQHPTTVNGFTFDNVLFTASSPIAGSKYTSTDGFLLYLTSTIGTSLAHVYATDTNPGGYEVDVVDPNDPGALTPFAVESFTITPAAVPEPTTLLLLATGALSGAGIVRRRFRASKAL